MKSRESTPRNSGHIKVPAESGVIQSGAVGAPWLSAGVPGDFRAAEPVGRALAAAPSSSASTEAIVVETTWSMSSSFAGGWDSTVASLLGGRVDVVVGATLSAVVVGVGVSVVDDGVGGGSVVDGTVLDGAGDGEVLVGTVDDAGVVVSAGGGVVDAGALLGAGSDVGIATPGPVSVAGGRITMGGAGTVTIGAAGSTGTVSLA